MYNSDGFSLNDIGTMEFSSMKYLSELSQSVHYMPNEINNTDPEILQ